MYKHQFVGAHAAIGTVVRTPDQRHPIAVGPAERRRNRFGESAGDGSGRLKIDARVSEGMNLICAAANTLKLVEFIGDVESMLARGGIEAER